MENNEGQGEGSSVSAANSSSVSAAELRQRRRDRILANKGSRMERILGSEKAAMEEIKRQEREVWKDKKDGDPISSSDPSVELLDWTKLSTRPGERVETEEENGVTIIRKLKKVPSGPEEKDGNVSRPAVPPPSPPAYGFMNIQPDGSTIHPKLSLRTCRVLILLLGIFLSVFNARHFLVTFFSWEVAVLLINGWPTMDDNNSKEDANAFSNLGLLMALGGVREEYVKKVKFFLKLVNYVVTDLSILIVSGLISKVLVDEYVLPALGK